MQAIHDLIYVVFELFHTTLQSPRFLVVLGVLNVQGRLAIVSDCEGNYSKPKYGSSREIAVQACLVAKVPYCSGQDWFVAAYSRDAIFVPDI
jgi:hypothetical protein